MRVLVFCQYYNPERFLLNEILPELVKRGHEITVITGIPNYPEGKIYPGYEDGKRNEEIVDGVRVLRCNIIPRGTSKIQLLLNYYSYMRKAQTRARRLEDVYDVVFLYQLTPIFQATPAVKYARKNKKSLLCYCLDLAPASGEDVAGKLNFLFSLYRRYSKWAYSNCDRIAVTSKGFINYLETVHGIPEERMIYLPQHAPDALISVDLHKEVEDGIPDFLFAGNIGFGARLDYVVEAAEKLKKQGLKFRVNFVGNGSDKQRLVEIVKEKKLGECVIFHNSVPMSDMDKIYRKADALLVSLRKGQVTVPSKVQAYMATGKPIFGSMDGSGYDLIRESGCGRCCPAEDAEGIASMMKDYILNPDQYNDCGEKGREYFRQNFTLTKYCDRLEELLQELTETMI